MSRSTSNFLPFTWDGWDIQDTACLTFYDVEMTEDFGKLKAGDKFKSVTVDFQDGFIHTYTDDSGDITDKVNFKLRAI